MYQYFKEIKEEKYIKALIIVLLFPAFLINLGLMPYILDEATRALVAYEMILSDNYFVPSINGEFYYNKPPLFNWILVLFFKITGSHLEIITRIPVVLSLAGFSITVYYTLKNEAGKKVAFLTALALLTCGRILFYDSFKGLIDISYSWVIYTNFWVVYYYHKKGRILLLFVISWLLTTTGFFMKGLPSLVFQGITLVVFFLYIKQFKVLFSWKSFLGGGIFLLITGMYFLIYARYNSIQNYFQTLWVESAGRTALYHSLKDSIIHLFTFPVEMIIHFLPWTLFLIFLIGKGRIKELWAVPFIRFFMVIFISNIMVYWISPVIYPRYLFMFLPLLFGVGTYAYYTYGLNSWSDRYILQPLLYLPAVLLPLALIIAPFVGRNQYHNDKLVYWILLLASSMFLTWLFFRYKSQRVLVFICVCLLTRVAFNTFVLPDRLITGRDNYFKQGALEAGTVTKGKPLYLYKDCPIDHVSSYYITAERRQILTRWYTEPVKDVYYILPLTDIYGNDDKNLIHVFETDIKGLELGIIKLNAAGEKH